MATQTLSARTRGNPLVIRDRDIQEVTVCNLGSEPVTRIYIPDDGCLIVEFHEPGNRRDPAPVMLRPGYAGRDHPPIDGGE